MKLIVTDTETGGLNSSKHSLLTLHMKVVDIDLNIIDQLSLSIKHEEYVVTADALRINKINLVAHDAIAIPVPNAQVMLDNFLMAHGHKERLIFTGHNAPFDEQFIKNTFTKNVWDMTVSYHMLDTISLGVFQKLLRHVSEKQSLSLGNYAKSLEAQSGESHTSSGDVETTLNILRKLVEKYQSLGVK